MATALKNTPRSWDLPLGKPTFPGGMFNARYWSEVDSACSLLPKLIGSNSWAIPNILNLSEDEMVWLSLEVHQWTLVPGYHKFVRYVSTLSVTNDSAERGIKLVQDFIGSSSKENTRQDIMLAVSAHRKEISCSDLTKKKLAKNSYTE